MTNINQTPSLAGSAILVLDDQEYSASFALHYRVDQVYDFFVLLKGLPKNLMLSVASEGKPIKVVLEHRPETIFNIKQVKDNQLWCKPVNGVIDDLSVETTEITEVRACLINFRFVLSKASEDNYSLKDETGSYRLGSTYFEMSGFRVEIRCTKDTELAHKQLRQDGGFAVTHLLKFKPTNQKTMSPKELNMFLTTLHQVLGFANGAWVGIHDIKGFNSKGNVSYFPIKNYLCTRHQGRFGWFNAYHGNVLRSLAPKLSEFLNKQETADIFDRALYWYVRANNSDGTGIDTSIILATTGLELLTEYSSEKFGKSVPSNNGRKPPLGDKIRAAALFHNIPINIDKITSPQSFALKLINQWEDIPTVIVKYRNDLVHPKAKIKSDDPHALTIEIWRLSVWYLELFILRIIGYDSFYSNRLKTTHIDEVELMPWAPE